MASIKNNNKLMKTYLYKSNIEDLKLKYDENEVSKIKIKIKKSSPLATSSNAPIRPTTAAVIITPRDEEARKLESIKNSLSSSTRSLQTDVADKNDAGSSRNRSSSVVSNMFRKLRKKRHNSLVTNYRLDTNLNSNFKNGLSSSVCFDSILMQQDNNDDVTNDTSVASVTSSKKSSFFNKKLKNILNMNRTFANDSSVSIRL